MNNWIKALVIAIALPMPVFAFEYHPDAVGKVSNRDEIVKGDTLSGYPIYVDGTGWKFFKYHKASTGGSAASVPIVSLLGQRFSDTGAFQFAQITTVTTQQNSSNGWLGEPCKLVNNDYEIARVNEVRGRFDRCAHVSLTERRIAGSMKPIVRGFAIETNGDGRYYSLEMWFSIESASKTASQFQSDANFKIKAQSWVNSMKGAVVRAASYDKPLNAFDGADSFVQLFVNAKSQSETKPVEVATPVTALETRLRKAKDLFDKGLITQSEYDALRNKALDEAK